VALPRMPIPHDRRFQARMVGYSAVKRNRLAEIASYGLLFAAFITVIVLIFATIPWLMRLPISPFAVDGALTSFGLIVYGITAALMGFLVVSLAALILILMLRKYLAVVQNRVGPIHNGPGGAFQTVADAIKLVSKEDFVPGQADRLVFTLAPAIVFVSAFLLLTVIPFAPTWVLANLNVGLLFIVAAGTLGAYGVLAAGWSVSNKYGLLGGLRAAAQLVSYEVPLSLSLLSVGVWVGSLNLLVIVESQYWVWTAFPLFISAAVYMVSSLAEIKMTPFDLPEAESELVAGFNTEYSGMRFGFFFVAEFAELFLLPAIAVVVFFGGYHQPFAGIFDLAEVFRNLGEPGTVLRDFGGFLANFYGMMWILLKTALLSWLIMWIRASLPRFRDDQLMELCWKGLMPLSFLGLAVAVVMRLVFKGFGG
jgi:NADH-quinone oxidoreductase subunit H